MEARRLRKYNRETRRQIQDGDVLLFRSHGFISKLIRDAGRTNYSHVAMAVWSRPAPASGVLLCCEVREWHGGRAVTLSSQVAKYPGLIDVYETNPDARFRFNPRKAADAMLRLAGSDYGYGNVLKAALLHLPIIRHFAKPDFNDKAHDARGLDCSAAISLCCRLGGVDPVLNLSDSFTEPGDLDRSNLFRYRFTLGT